MSYETSGLIDCRSSQFVEDKSQEIEGATSITADPRQCSCIWHSSAHALQILMFVSAGNLPLTEVTQNSGAAIPVEECKLPDGQ